MNIDFKRGELVSAARAYLALYMEMLTLQKRSDDHALNAVNVVLDRQEQEVLRLVRNEFQLHQSELGDPVMFCLTVLLMNGEEHTASERFARER